MRTDQVIIEAINLGKKVETSEGTLDILTAANLSINSGETVAIVGASGSGKSTLLGLLAGLDTPTTGAVRLAGATLTDLDEDGRAAVRAQKVGFVFQSFQLLDNLTALENVMLPLELTNSDDAPSQAKAMLAKVSMDHRLTHYPKQLSGGEQQRVALARAFVTLPSVLFADEPTGNLDSRTGGHIIDLLLGLNSEHKTTLVLVTHDPALAQRCQRIIRLESGRIADPERRESPLTASFQGESAHDRAPIGG
jgi:putative ABC transport system ATP-binding protein